jgi:hypothetical protein
MSEDGDVRRALATTLAAGLILTACSGAEDDGDLLDLQATPEPTEEATEDPEPEEEPEPDDPYAVPDEIDEAYVENVINAILEVRSEVLRGALQQEQGENLAAELMALHFATTEGTQRATGLETFQRYIDEPDSRENFLAVDDLGTTTFRPELLVHAEPDQCIIVVGFWDNSQIVENPRAEEDFVAFSLSRVDESSEASEGNPTPWQWRDNAAMQDGSGLIPRDQWEDLDYASALDHTCEEL